MISGFLDAMKLVSAVAPVAAAGFQGYQLLQAGKQQDSAAAAQEAAGQEALRIAAINAEKVEAEAAETIRRRKKVQDYAMGAARARGAASGVALSGSTQMYIDEMGSEYRQELDWLRRSAEANVEIERRKGQQAAASARYAAQTTRAGATSSRAAAAGSIGKGLTKLPKAYETFQWAFG